jgi:hypothetical protein
MVSAKLSRGPEWLGCNLSKINVCHRDLCSPFLPRDDVCSPFPLSVSFPKALGPSYEMLVSVLLVAVAGSALAQNSADLFAPKYPVVAYAAGSVCLLVPTLRRVWLISK